LEVSIIIINSCRASRRIRPEVSNKGVIIIADVETDAKEDGDDKKSDDNNDVPGTSLERKKRKRKDRNRATAKILKKKKEKEGNKTKSFNTTPFINMRTLRFRTKFVISFSFCCLQKDYHVKAETNRAKSYNHN